METRLDHEDGRQIITDGETFLPVPAGYTLIRDFAARQAELDHDTIFEMLLALHEIRDIGNDQVNEIVDRALNLYGERQTLVDDLQGLRRIGA